MATRLTWGCRVSSGSASLPQVSRAAIGGYTGPGRRPHHESLLRYVHYRSRKAVYASGGLCTLPSVRVRFAGRNALQSTMNSGQRAIYQFRRRLSIACRQALPPVLPVDHWSFNVICEVNPSAQLRHPRCAQCRGPRRIMTTGLVAKCEQRIRGSPSMTRR